MLIVIQQDNIVRQTIPYNEAVVNSKNEGVKENVQCLTKEHRI